VTQLALFPSAASERDHVGVIPDVCPMEVRLRTAQQRSGGRALVVTFRQMGHSWLRAARYHPAGSSRRSDFRERARCCYERARGEGVLYP